jgi:uncharacterized membrane protein YhaH (DUF805 family)
MSNALQGRIGRKSYWAGTALVLFLVIVLVLILVPSNVKRLLHGDVAALPDDPGFIVVAMAGLWTVNARRLHDRNHTAWWLAAPAVLLGSTLAWLWGAPGPAFAFYAAALIALPITLWMIVEACFLAGTTGPNRFGSEPTTADLIPPKTNWKTITSASIRGLLLSPLGWPLLILFRLIEMPFVLVQERHILFGFTGRLDRRDFWTLNLCALIGALFINALAVFAVALPLGQQYEQVDANPRMQPVHLAVLALGLWTFAAICSKRMHDRDHSAWWAMAFSPLLLVILLPLLGPNPVLESTVGVILLPCCPFALWLFIQLGFLKGTDGPNRFGPDPNLVRGTPMQAATSRRTPNG